MHPIQGLGRQHPVVPAHAIPQVHEEQGAVVARSHEGAALQVRVVGRHEGRRVAVERGRVAVRLALQLDEVVVEGEHIQAAGLHVDLVNEGRPRFPGRHLGDSTSDLPLGPAVSELRVRRDDVGIVVGGGEHLLGARLECANGQELADVGPICRVREQAHQTRAVGDQLGRRDLGVPCPPPGYVGHRCVDVQEAVVVESHQHAGHDHLGRRGDERDPFGPELPPVLVVNNAVVALHHDQAGPVEALEVDEILDDRRDGGEVIGGDCRFGLDCGRRRLSRLGRDRRGGRGARRRGGCLRCNLDGRRGSLGRLVRDCRGGSLRHRGRGSDRRRRCRWLVSSRGVASTGRQDQEGREDREGRHRACCSGHRTGVAINHREALAEALRSPSAYSHSQIRVATRTSLATVRTCRCRCCARHSR